MATIIEWIKSVERKIFNSYNVTQKAMTEKPDPYEIILLKYNWKACRLYLLFLVYARI